MNQFCGNNYLVQLSQFAALYEMGWANGDSVGLGVLTQYRNARFQESINNNPSSTRPSAASSPLRLHGHLFTCS
jgi:hypothetical protein